MIRRMFHSKRFRAGVAGLVVGSVALSGCAHEPNGMFAKVWPFGKDKAKTAASSDIGETQIASSTPSAPQQEDKPSVGERIGDRFAKLVGREDEFPQDPFMAEYSEGSGAQQAVAQTSTGVANVGEMGGIQTVSGRESINPRRPLEQQTSPQAGPPQSNQFAANFGAGTDQIGRRTNGTQQSAPGGDISQQRVDELRASLRRDMLGQSSADPAVRPIPDQPTQVAQQTPTTANPFSNAAANPFEDPRLLSFAAKPVTQDLPKPPQTTAPTASGQSSSAFNNVQAFENGFEHGAKIAGGAVGQTESGLGNAIKSQDGFGHGRAAWKSNHVTAPQLDFGNVPNDTTEDEDSLYNQILESDDVPSGKFYGPRDFDAVQTNQSINLHPKPNPSGREIPSVYESASPGFNEIHQASNETPNVTSNQSVSLPKVDVPPALNDGPSFGSNNSATVPGGLGGPLMVAPDTTNSVEQPVQKLASNADVVPPSPLKKVKWADDDFVVENGDAEEASSWPTIMLLAAALAAIVGLMIRRNGTKPETPQGLRLLQDDDSDRKAA